MTATQGKDDHSPSSEEGGVSRSWVAALYVEHGEELRRFLAALLRDSQLAADVLQVAFARMLEQGPIQQEESRKGWLFRVAYREALAVRRRSAVGERVHREAAEGRQDQADANSVDDSLLRHETVERVRAALRTLRQEEREVVQLRMFEDKKFVEIAAELQIPLGTALGRMRNALNRLRAVLEDDNA